MTQRFDRETLRAVAEGNSKSTEKDRLVGIVSMLVGLIKSNSSSRVYETPAEYLAGLEERIGQ